MTKATRWLTTVNVKRRGGGRHQGHPHVGQVSSLGRGGVHQSITPFIGRQGNGKPPQEATHPSHCSGLVPEALAPDEAVSG